MNYTPSSTRIAFLKSQVTEAEALERWNLLENALNTGATQLTLPGQSGTLSHDTMLTQRADYEAVILAHRTDSDADSAIDQTPAPMAHTIRFTGPIGF